MLVLDELQKSALDVRIRDHRAAIDASAVAQHNPRGATALDDDPLDPGVKPDLGTSFADGLGQCIGEFSRTAQRVETP